MKGGDKVSTLYNPFTGCPAGLRKRGAYTHKISGRRIPALCIRTSKGVQNKSESPPNLSRKVGTNKVINSAKCPPGYILRKGYVRKFRTSIRRRGYTVHRKNGRTYRIFPKKANDVEVRATCVKDVGAPGKYEGPSIGPLRRGELLKYGYQYRQPTELRREALKRAVQEYTPLGVYRKLDAVAKLSEKVKPAASDVFAADRDWIRGEYALTESLMRIQ